MIKKENLSHEESLFLDNFALILLRSVEIVQTPEFYNCRPNFTSSSCPSGAPHPTIGELCTLWGYGKFMSYCSKCGSQYYLIRGSGNLSGGISDRVGICMDCQEYFYEDGPGLFVSKILCTYMNFRKEGKLKSNYEVRGMKLEELIERLLET